MLVSNELGRFGQTEKACGLEGAGLEAEREEARSRLRTGHEGPCGRDEGLGFSS